MAVWLPLNYVQPDALYTPALPLQKQHHELAVAAIHTAREPAAHLK